jgi:DNA-binding transcriptional LysR family regulator
MLRFDVGEDLLHYYCNVDRLTVYATLPLGLDAAASLGDDVSGRLRINLPRAMLPLVANRLLPDFLEAYPNVQLELCGDDK